ncbi:hypothetical protein [Thermococcus sp.]
MSMEKVIMIIGYGVFLIIFPLLLYGSFAFVDGIGIGRRLSGGLTALLILLLSAIVFTVLGLVPLIFSGKSKELIKQMALTLFVTSFIFNTILLFISFMSMGC